MQESLKLLLLEAKTYKEELTRSLFALNQFSERLLLVENKELNELATDLQEESAEIEAINSLLENAAVLLGAKLSEEEQVTAENAFSVAEEVPAEENAFTFIEEENIGEDAVDISGMPDNSIAEVYEKIEDISDAPIPAEGSAFAPIEEECNNNDAANADEWVMLPHDEVVGFPIPDDVYTPVKERSEFCYVDDDGTVYCGNCGGKLKTVSKFCARCGALIQFREEEKEAEAPEDKIEAPEEEFDGYINQEPKVPVNAFPEFIEEIPEDKHFAEDISPEPEIPVQEYVSHARPAAFLVRQKDNSIIHITADEFLIGRDPAKVDFCITDNTAISRVHAKIFFSNNHYYISDCNSVNGTYLNERRLKTDFSTLLVDGCSVRLSSEKFTFQVSF